MRKSAFRSVLESAVSRAARSAAVTLVDAGTSLAAEEEAVDVGFDCAWMLRREVGGLVMDTALGLASTDVGRRVWVALAEFRGSRLRGA